MKIAYISPIFYSDVDISYLSELRKIPEAEIFYFIPIGPLKKSAAINIDNIYPHRGIFQASIYPELSRFADIIDLNHTYVINRTSAHSSYPENIMVYIKLVWMLKRIGVDVVHISSFLSYTEFPLFLLRKKIILSVHDPLPHADVEKSWRDQIQRKISFRLLDNFVIFNSAQENSFIEKYNLKNKRIYISSLSSYTYLRIYDTLPSTNEYGDYILFFGWIRKGKGVEILLEAMKKVHEVYPDLNLIIAGKGAFYFDASSYISLDYIYFLNRFIPDIELVHLVSNSLFVVCPYTEATQSGVVMTSYACSKPVVVTDVGGLPEMVDNDRYGIVAQSLSVEALKESILKMLSEPNLISTLKKNINNDYNFGVRSWLYIANKVYNELYKIVASHDKK